MIWLIKFLIVQVVIRAVGWVMLLMLALIGAMIPDAVTAKAAAAWTAFEGVLWNPWLWVALLALAYLGDWVILARRRRIMAQRRTS